MTTHPWFDGRDWLKSEWHRRHVAAGTERVSRRGECLGPLQGAAKKRAEAAGLPPFEYAGTRALTLWKGIPCERENPANETAASTEPARTEAAAKALKRASEPATRCAPCPPSMSQATHSGALMRINSDVDSPSLSERSSPMNQPLPSSIALIDISYLFKKRWHTPGFSPTDAGKATLRDLEALREGVGHVIVCRDAKPYHREKLYPQYKANRTPATPDEIAQKRWVYEEINRRGFNTAHSEGYEADDVIATLARIYSVWCTDVRLICPDKDAAQCVTDRVVQYIPATGDRQWEVRDVAGVVKKFGVPPRLMPLYQGLCGDSGDNIPGVLGIGQVKAQDICSRFPSVQRIGQWMNAPGSSGKDVSMAKAVRENWENFKLSVQLATLDVNVPLDADALLVKRAPEPEKRHTNVMGSAPEEELVFERNETPMPPAANDGADEVFEAAKEAYREALPRIQATAPKEELLEKEYEREQQKNEEPAAPPPPKPAERTADWSSPGPAPEPRMRRTAPASIVVPKQQPIEHPKYGLVTADLQPCDLTAAYKMSEWLHRSNLYQQYTNEAQIFAVMVRAKELGIGVTTALAGFHIIDGKPVAHADLIRALAERDPTFEYLMPIEMSATRAVWEGKKRGQPKPVQFSYTIEEAAAAKLIRNGPRGPNNWMTRPQDMLVKTAGSKGARLLWPGPCMGLYCYEEMGYSQEELEARVAA